MLHFCQHGGGPQPDECTPTHTYISTWWELKLSAETNWVLHIFMIFSMSWCLQLLSILALECFKKESKWAAGPYLSHSQRTKRQLKKYNWKIIEFHSDQIGEKLFLYSLIILKKDVFRWWRILFRKKLKDHLLSCLSCLSPAAET